jgi:predicted Ser/Thr protein kinase
VDNGDLVGGRFRVERVVGRGGMGDVYAARHVTTGKEVALKVLRSTEGAWRFTREARTATALRHPNVVEVYDLFEDDGTPVMVMELLRGETFAVHRAQRGALTLQATSQILVPVLHAVRAAHRMGIVHRDIKPENIFLAETDGGRVPKILDFGIAKMLDPAKLGSGTHGRDTNTGAVLGTPDYMSYEQAMSEPVDSRTDVWSVGVIVFESLSGRRPIVFDTLGQMYAAFLQGSVLSIRDVVPELPADAAAAIDHCLVKKPEGRTNDLTPLIDVLVRYIDGTVAGAGAGGRVVTGPLPPSLPTVAATVHPLARTPLRRRGLVAAALTLGTAAGVGLLVRSRVEAGRPHPAEAPAAMQLAPGAHLPGEPLAVAAPSTTPADVGRIDAGNGDIPPVEASASKPLPIAPNPSVAGRTGRPNPTAVGSPAARDGSAPAPQKHGIVDTDPYSPALH